jgi:lipoprotein-anchoring transpeptidase ErfK/SrfK
MRHTTSGTRLRTGWILALFLFLGTSISAQTGSQRQVLISLADRKLALVENGDVVKVYPIAVGKSSTPSPKGKFRVVNRVSNPTYYHTGTVIPPGPQNPLGTRWMGLSEKGYGIHGTNAPHSIGKAASQGCIRMARADLEDLFNRVQVGDEVEIREDRDPQISKIFVPKPAMTSAGTQIAPVLPNKIAAGAGD